MTERRGLSNTRIITVRLACGHLLDEVPSDWTSVWCPALGCQRMREVVTDTTVCPMCGQTLKHQSASEEGGNRG
jgi:hypothetical protein